MAEILKQHTHKIWEGKDEEINRRNHTSEGYLFNKDGESIKETAVSWRLKKYCKHLGILYKSPHKIRKTYISTLIDDGLNIDTIRRLAGHEDEKTTYGSYCYDRHSSKQVEAQLENALCMKRSIAFNKVEDLAV